MFHAYEHGSWFVNKNYLIVLVGGGPCCTLHAFDNFCGAQTLSNKGRMFLASKQTPSVRDQPRAEKLSVVIGKCTEHRRSFHVIMFENGPHAVRVWARMSKVFFW